MTTKSNVLEATLTNHLQAFLEASIDGVMRDYAKDAVLITRDGPLRGVSEIRAFFVRFIETLPTGFLQAFKLHRQEFIADVGYIVWDALPWARLGTDSFVVRDGKIVLQTFAAYPPSW
ncbi:MAG TPA: nuclear transport factor 2 family protein [Polyangiaceae bacterium]|nr:nuclear transport factor 2 family protein [Polyangiaceae bacterium]